jgi:hypothetical protein
MPEIVINNHSGRPLTPEQDEALKRLILNGELRGDIDVFEVGPAVRFDGFDRGSFLAEPGGQVSPVREWSPETGRRWRDEPI